MDESDFEPDYNESSQDEDISGLPALSPDYPSEEEPPELQPASPTPNVMPPLDTTTSEKTSDLEQASLLPDAMPPLETTTPEKTTDLEQTSLLPDEMPPLEPIIPEETFADDGPGQTLRRKMLCPFPGCDHTSNKMKRHVIRYHICHDQWWFMYPLLSCWTCKRWEIAVHVREHGPFREEQHMGQLNNHVYEFVYFITASLKLRSPRCLPGFVANDNLGDRNSSFSAVEERVWDAYDKHQGLPPLLERTLQFPTRISSVLHWRTLQRLLLLVPPSTPLSPLPLAAPDSPLAFIDSHCHVDRLLHTAHRTGTLAQFLEDEAIETTNFRGCIANFCDEDTLTNEKRWAELVDDHFVVAAVGFHPKQARRFTQDTDRVIRSLLDHPKACALGEVGLDYSGEHGRFKSVQRSVFRRLLRMAVELHKPVVLHCRDAEDDCLEIATEILPPQWKIHLHCYTNGWKGAQNWCRKFPNLCVGLTTMITWDVPEPREVAKKIPLDRLLLETDAPYFIPRGLSHIGYSNPTMAHLVAREVARIRGEREEDVLKQCMQNTCRLYNISF